jgi:AraC family transcriptional regulator, transcriptional activator of pobA
LVIAMLKKIMARRTIPQYFLYGEATQDVDERFLHVESIAERSVRHGWVIRPHAHRDLFHLLLVLKGGGVFHAEGAAHPFAANTLIGVPLSCVHGFDFRAGTNGWIITASGVLLTRIAREHPELAPVFEEACVTTLANSSVAGTVTLFNALVAEFRGNLPVRRAAAESWLTSIAVAVLRRRLALAPNTTRTPSSDSLLAGRYRSLVDLHYRSAWSIADYANKLCIGQERLRVACVRTTGSSPIALLNARRLLEAKRSLLYTSMSVALIAESCGFPDPAYFSRFFARSTGQSPRAYRLGKRDTMSLA